jgi:hypothetical protein
MQINREEFLGKLRVVAVAVSNKEVIEQSTCLVFRDGKVSAFNDELSCSIEDKSLVGIEAAVPSSTLLGLLDKMEDKEIEASLEEGELRLSGKRKRAGLRIEEEILLPVDKVEAPGEWTPAPEDLSNALRAVVPCASKGVDRFDLMCVHLHPEWIEAHDESQAIRWPIDIGIKESCLVKAVVLGGIAGLGLEKVSQTENWLHFACDGGAVISCRLWKEQCEPIGHLFGVEGVKVTLWMV